MYPDIRRTIEDFILKRMNKVPDLGGTVATLNKAVQGNLTILSLMDNYALESERLTPHELKTLIDILLPLNSEQIGGCLCGGML